MTERDYRLLLREMLGALADADRWLRRSDRLCRAINVEGELSEEDYDALETLTSRFARLSDMILQKAFRGIDRVELESGGTLLDVLARAEKRGLIESLEQFRLLRELRNEIAHEYALADLVELFRSVKEQAPALFEIVDRIRAYCEQYTVEERDGGPGT